jgi:integrase
MRTTCSPVRRRSATNRLVRVLLFTAQRESKVAEMKWADVKDGAWTIATEDREKGNAEVLHLPQMAMEFVTERRRLLAMPMCSLCAGKVLSIHFPGRTGQADAVRHAALGAARSAAHRP